MCFVFTGLQEHRALKETFAVLMMKSHNWQAFMWQGSGSSPSSPLPANCWSKGELSEPGPLPRKRFYPLRLGSRGAAPLPGPPGSRRLKHLAPAQTLTISVGPALMHVTPASGHAAPGTGPSLPGLLVSVPGTGPGQGVPHSGCRVFCCRGAQAAGGPAGRAG